MGSLYHMNRPFANRGTGLSTGPLGVDQTSTMAGLQLKTGPLNWPWVERETILGLAPLWVDQTSRRRLDIFTPSA